MSRIVDIRYWCDQCEIELEGERLKEMRRVVVFYSDESPMMTLHFCSAECFNAFSSSHPVDESE